MQFVSRFVSSLEKIFADEEIRAPELIAASALKGEVFSFQLALKNIMPASNPPSAYNQITTHMEVVSKLPAELREVRAVPVDVPGNYQDAGLLRNQPGLFPDLLLPLDDGCFRFPARQWRSFWITVRVPADCRAGKYPVTVRVTPLTNGRSPSLTNEPPQEFTFVLEVLKAKQPKSPLLRYEWFHHDGLLKYYGIEAWSEEHWRVLEKFFAGAAAHGMNVLLTPLWTPPLDTAIGKERLTVQLLKIKRRGKRYTFDFSRLERYVETARKAGITHFAMAHAFTQWGAKATPKIIAEVDGKEQRIFGWDVPSDSPEYRAFLTQLMPKLLAFFRERGLAKNIIFSVSDEPREEHFETYGAASKLLRSLIDGATVIDALSSIEFYRRGLISDPIPAIDHIEDFVGVVEPLNAYYCISQEDRVPNRFIAMPSWRNRAIGVMFYLYRINLFLQWGYNFYNQLCSVGRLCDPFRETCAGNWTPAGDAFIVYPGPEGQPYDSLRHEVFFEAIQDHAALLALEKKIGRDAVVALIQEGVPYRITMRDYPREAGWLLALRERVNRLLA